MYFTIYVTKYVPTVIIIYWIVTGATCSLFPEHLITLPLGTLTHDFTHSLYIYIYTEFVSLAIMFMD